MILIVAPTDFPDISLKAVNYATDIAGAIQASLSLAHPCCPLPVGLPEQIRQRNNGKSMIYTELRDGNPTGTYYVL